MLLLFGVGLLVAEIFLIPGFGFAGVFGFASLVASVVMAYVFISPLAGHVTLCAAVAFSAVAVYVFLKGKTLDRMALKTDIDAKVDLVSDLDLHEGDTVEIYWKEA